jgi:hypothetical protein
MKKKIESPSVREARLRQRIIGFRDMTPAKEPPEKKPKTIHRLTLMQLSTVNSGRLTHDDLGIVNDRDRRLECTGTTWILRRDKPRSSDPKVID